jgi:hypothetical protein
MYDYGIRTKVYEACSFSIYWALKHNFNLGITSIKTDSIASNDCIFTLLSFRYDKRYKTRPYLNEYKVHARSLQASDFQQHWLYIYETLPLNDLQNEFKNMKRNGVTFIRNGF